GLPVVADLLVPEIDHLRPLRAAGLPLGRAVVGRRAVAGRWLLEVGANPAANAHGAEDGSDAAAEAHRLVHRVVPAGGRVQRSAEVLQSRPGGEDTDADRIFEVAPATDPRDHHHHFLTSERIDARRQSQLGDVDGHLALKRAGGRRARVEHFIPAGAMVVATWRTALVRVDRGVVGRATQLLRGALDAFGEHVADALPQVHHVVHAAGVALMAAVIEALAELRRLPVGQLVVGDVGRVVLDGQRAELAEVHDAGQRAVLVERLRRWIGLEIVGDVVGGLDGAAVIGRLERSRALDDGDGLQLLLAHHGAHAVLRRHVAVITVDRREAHEVLAGRADRVYGDLMPGEAGLAVQRFLRL